MIFLCDADCALVAGMCRFTGVCRRMRYPSWPPFWSVRKSCTCTTGTGACCPRLVPILPFPGSFCHYPGPFTQSRCVKCMGACNRPCVVAFAAAGKSTYLFGDLDRTSVTEVSQSILECASLYHCNPDGTMKWSERPERLRKSVIGVIPSIAIPVSI